MTTQNQVAVVTGASSGIGELVAPCGPLSSRARACARNWRIPRSAAR